MKHISKWVLIFVCAIVPFFQINARGMQYHVLQVILCSMLILLFFLKFEVIKLNKFQIKLTSQLGFALCYAIPLYNDFFGSKGLNKPLGFVLLIFSFAMAILVFGTEWEVKEEKL